MRKKPFETREEILALIETKKRKRSEHESTAEKYEAEAEKLNRQAAREDYGSEIFWKYATDASELKKYAVKHRRSVSRCGKVLERLKCTLSAYDTELLPGISDDKSVRLQ